jgi:hypothetical protein
MVSRMTKTFKNEMNDDCKSCSMAKVSKRRAAETTMYARFFVVDATDNSVVAHWVVRDHPHLDAMGPLILESCRGAASGHVGGGAALFANAVFYELTLIGCDVRTVPRHWFQAWHSPRGFIAMRHDVAGQGPDCAYIYALIHDPRDGATAARLMSWPFKEGRSPASPSDSCPDGLDVTIPLGRLAEFLGHCRRVRISETPGDADLTRWVRRANRGAWDRGVVD